MAISCGSVFFSCKNADEILNPILRERVRVLKETEGGRQEVCQIMENRINEEKIELAKDAIIKGDLTLDVAAELSCRKIAGQFCHQRRMYTVV